MLLLWLKKAESSLTSGPAAQPQDNTEKISLYVRDDNAKLWTIADLIPQEGFRVVVSSKKSPLLNIFLKARM